MFKTYSIEDSFINLENKRNKETACVWQSNYKINGSVELTLSTTKAQKIVNDKGVGKLVLTNDLTVVEFEFNEDQNNKINHWIRLLALNYNLTYQGRNVEID